MKKLLPILAVPVMLAIGIDFLGANQDQDSHRQSDGDRKIMLKLEKANSQLIDVATPDRAIVIPARERINPELQKLLQQFLEDCPDCQDVPIIVDPTPKNPVPPQTTPGDFCAKYPGKFGCKAKQGG